MAFSSLTALLAKQVVMTLQFLATLLSLGAGHGFAPPGGAHPKSGLRKNYRAGSGTAGLDWPPPRRWSAA